MTRSSFNRALSIQGERGASQGPSVILRTEHAAAGRLLCMAAAFDDFQELVDQFPDLVCRYRPDGLLLYVNSAYAAFYGGDRADIVGRSFLELCDPDVREEVEAALRVVQRLTPERPIAINEHRAVDLNGRLRWLHWTDKGVFDQSGVLTEVMAIGRDVTDRRMAEDQAMYLADHDSLTGLLNRRSMLELLDDALLRCRQRAKQIAVLYVDLDRFKEINDQWGHDVGDRVLEEAAERLVAGFRPGDLLSRIGGDEFVIACSDTTDAEVEALVRRAKAILAEPMIGLDGVIVTASIGWALSDGHHSAAELLKRSDRAMYAAKSGGRAARRT